jgi:quercetin dioxygenase-like cupin family protein
MRRIVGLLTLSCLVGVVATKVYSQNPAPIPRDGSRGPISDYFTTPLERDPSRVVSLQSVTALPHRGNGFHRHPGDQWAVVQDGEMVLTIKGQAPKTLKAGESIYIPRGTIHMNENRSDKPAQVVELTIVDKDVPATELVRD